MHGWQMVFGFGIGGLSAGFLRITILFRGGPFPFVTDAMGPSKRMRKVVYMFLLSE